MSFVGIINGSVYSEHPPQHVPGADWNIPSTAYNPHRLAGVVNNFNTPYDPSPRISKVLSEHPYNKYIESFPIGLTDVSQAIAVAYAPEAAYIRLCFHQGKCHEGRGSVADVKTVMKEMTPEFKAKVKSRLNNSSIDLSGGLRQNGLSPFSYVVCTSRLNASYCDPNSALDKSPSGSRCDEIKTVPGVTGQRRSTDEADGDASEPIYSQHVESAASIPLKLLRCPAYARVPALPIRGAVADAPIPKLTNPA